MRQRIHEYIQAHQQELYDLLSELIHIDTQNFITEGTETALANYLKARYEALGLEAEVYSPDSLEGITSHEDYLPGRNLANRCNVTARLPGTGGGQSVMLAAHLDTVPVGDRSLWTVDPFSGLQKDGKIYGRGACDDKYALAACLFLARMFRALNIRLPGDVYLTGYVDEEHGGGDGALAACLYAPTDLLLNLDGKHMDIMHCGVGGQRQVVEIRHEGPLDCCGRMIEGILAVKEEIDRFGEKRRAELAANPNLTGDPRCALRYMNVHTGTHTNDRNIAYVDFAFYTDRTMPEIRAELNGLEGAIDRKMREMGLCFAGMKPLSRLFRYVCTDADAQPIRLMEKTVAQLTGQSVHAQGGMMLSDLSVFAHAAKGTAFSFGAGRAFDVEGGAHLPNEYIEMDVLRQFTETIACFVLEWAQTNESE